MLVWPSFCAACGQGLRREDKFCSNCGVPVPQQPFESAGTMARPAFSDQAPAEQAAPQEALAAPAAEALPAAEASRTTQPPPAAEMVSPEATPSPEEKAGVPAAFSPVPTAYDYVPSPPTAYDYVEPAAVEKPRRKKSRLPVLEILVIILLIVGAGAAVWMLRSSLPAKRTAVPANVAVTLLPATARVAPGHSLDFAATVSGTDDLEVDWSVQEGDAGGRVVPRGAKASGGQVASLAVYIAPDSPGTYHLVATSRADPQQSAAAGITVKAGKSR
jgi:hypothetical protein